MLVKFFDRAPRPGRTFGRDIGSAGLRRGRCAGLGLAYGTKDLSALTGGVMDQQEKGLFPRAGVRFEVACDVIGALIAHHGEAIAGELVKSVPADAVIAEAERAMALLRDERDALDPTDAVAVEDVIKRYAPQARALYGR